MKIPFDNSLKPYLYTVDKERYHIYKNIYLQNKFLNIQKLEDLKELIKEFPEILILKGCDLVLNYYNDPGAREFEDVDILIEPASVKSIEKYLLCSGYKSYIRSEKLNSFEYYRGITKFHIHTKLENALYPQPHFKELDKNYRNYLKISCIDGLKYNRLEENFNFIYILMHTLKHNFDKSIRIIDIIKMSRTVQWGKVYAIAKELKCINLVIFTLRYLFTQTKSDININTLIFKNDFMKKHSGLDLLFYYYLKPLHSIPSLLLLCKGGISKVLKTI